jgi:hypothetical protein
MPCTHVDGGIVDLFAELFSVVEHASPEREHGGVNIVDVDMAGILVEEQRPSYRCATGIKLHVVAIQQSIIRKDKLHEVRKHALAAGISERTLEGVPLA